MFITFLAYAFFVKLYGDQSHHKIKPNIAASSEFSTIVEAMDQLVGTWVGGGQFTCTFPEEFSLNSSLMIPNNFTLFQEYDFSIKENFVGIMLIPYFWIWEESVFWPL